jgi:uncharacterized protein (TIGR03437 family)
MPRSSPRCLWTCAWRLLVLALATFGVANAQTLTVTPQELTFNVIIGGGNPPNQTVQVSSGTPGQAFSVAKSPSPISSAWLSFTPNTGATPATVTFSVNASLVFTPGSQTVDVVVSPTGTSGQGQTVRVRLVATGTPTGPLLQVTPGTLSFNAPSGTGSLPTQTIQVRNIGSNFLDYQIGIEYQTAATGWASVTPTTGSVQGNTQNPHVVGVNPSGLSPGLHRATLRVTGNSPNSPQFVQISLTVQSPPSLLVDPGQLSFSASDGGDNPPPQNITISSQAGGTIAYDIVSDQTWLTVSPTQGTTASGSQVHAVSVNIEDLSQGNFTGNLTIRPQNLPEINVAVSLSVAMPSAILTIPSRLEFSGNTRVPVRERRLLSIISNPLVTGRWTARVVPPTVSWVKISPAEGAVPGNLLVEIDNQNLGAATLEAQIEITQAAPAALSVKTGGRVAQAAGTALIPVTLTLVNQDGTLDATPQLLEFSTTAGSTTVLEQILYAESRGGPALNWQSEITTDNGEAWLSVNPATGTAPTRLKVSADPAGLDAGVHHGRIRLISGSHRVDVPVSLLVQGDEGVLATDQSSLYFEVQQGVATVLEKTMRVLNRGEGALSWTTHVREQSGTLQWLAVTPNSGNSEGGSGNPPVVTFTVRTDALAAGVQSALVEVEADDGQSRFVTVILNVLAAGSTPTPSIDPSGLAFTATASAVTPPAQQIWLRSNQSSATGFLAGATTFNGGNWLRVQPATGNVVAGGTPLEITVSHAGLAAGLYRGMVGVTFGDGVVRSTPVLLTVRPAGSGCVPASTTLSPISPLQNFVAATGRATWLETVVADDCGTGIAGAAMLAVFNNGDPALPLRDLGGGRYGATWAPRNAGSQVNIRYEMVTGPSIEETAVVGTVASTAAPRLSQQSSVNGASFARGEALASGGIMSSFGFNLAVGNNIAEEVPLPTSLGGVRLFVDGQQAPLFFAGIGQINSQVPFETAPGRTADVIVSVNGQFTVPQQITVASARPGIFALPAAAGLPRAIAQNQDFSLNGPANPAARGEAIVVYLTAVGEVEPAVATGEGAPSEEPLARATLPATAAIGGQPAEILFLGLTPGFVGLVQANLIVPADSQVGPDVPLVITVDGQPSNSMVIAVGQE